MQMILRVAISILLPLSATVAAGQELVDGGACGSLSNAFGPFDYRHARHADLNIVEEWHFTPSVAALMHGHTGSLGGDIGYTLRAFPNHPRALLAMSLLARREHTIQPAGSIYTVQCWFDRAIAFAPDDPMVRILYANYLVEEGERDKAQDQLRSAQGADLSDPNVTYNLGLVYFRLKNFDLARTYARRAYALGFPLPGLRNLLISAGQWQPDAVHPEK